LGSLIGEGSGRGWGPVGRGALRQAPRDHAAVPGGERRARDHDSGLEFLRPHIPNAILLVYPDAGHGSLFQYHDSFVQQAQLFLDS